MVKIEGNGIGFENELNNRDAGHQSRGMQNIRDKVDTLEQSGIALVKIKYKMLLPAEKEFPGKADILNIRDLTDYGTYCCACEYSEGNSENVLNHVLGSIRIASK